MGNEFVCWSLSNRFGEANHLQSHSAVVKNLWSFPSTSPYIFTSCMGGKFTFIQPLLPVNQTYGESYHQIYIIWTPHQVSFGDKIKKKSDGLGLGHVWGREGHTGFWWGNLREKEHLTDLGVDWGDNMSESLRK